MIGSELRTFLLENTEIAAAVGERVYINRIADIVPSPFIELELIAGGSIQRSFDSNKIETVLWQIKVRDEVLSRCHSTAILVKALCDGFQGDINSYNVLMEVVLFRGDFEEKSRHFVRQLDVEVKYGQEKS